MLKKYNYFEQILFIILSGIIINNPVYPQFSKRLDFNALLEPDSTIIHGAGQSDSAFENYYMAMQPNIRPAVYMSYYLLRDTDKDLWQTDIVNALKKYSDTFVILQIGLSMTIDGTPSEHYEKDVADGKYNKQISGFLDALEEIGRPVYLRIGYEFNGLSWNGYQQENYKLAFARITDSVKQRGLEVATVWDFSPDGTNDYMSFYPGDNKVDWWGFNPFFPSNLTDTISLAFIDSARVHNKPVMIGESTPRSVGVSDGLSDWNAWFKPFFDLIYNKPEIKMFCYIDWDWRVYPSYVDWGDCRIETNQEILNNWQNQLNSLLFTHANNERTFRASMGNPDYVAPTKPSGLSIVDSVFPPLIKWNPVNDFSGIARYEIYRNGVLTTNSVKSQGRDKTLHAGMKANYTIIAVDRAGNKSIPSDSITYQSPDHVEILQNGNFDLNDNNWFLKLYNGANASFTIDSNSSISGIGKSAKVVVTGATGTNWNIQLLQPFFVQKDLSYKVQFKGQSDSLLSFDVLVQKDGEPYTTLSAKNITLNNLTKTYLMEFVPDTSELVNLTFMLGKKNGSLWFDSISVIESHPIQTYNHLFQTSNDNITDFRSLNLYGKVWQILWNQKHSENVSIKAFDISGKLQDILINSKRDAGNYSINWKPRISAKTILLQYRSGDIKTVLKINNY